MKKYFFKTLLVVGGLVSIEFVRPGEPLVEHITLAEPSPTHPLSDHRQQEENQHLAEALRLKNIQEKESHLPTQHPLPKEPLSTTSAPHPRIDTTLSTKRIAKDIASTDTLTEKERETLKLLDQHTFTHASPSADIVHSADPQPQLNFIRPKIVRHLAQELSKLKEKLSPEQIKNREMVIKFFNKAGELTQENLEAFRPLYKKLAEWDETSELTLTSEEQKEMKRFLQSIITTYCANHQTTKEDSNA